MRPRLPFILVGLLLCSFVVPIQSLADTSITTNTTWSSSMTMTGNVTVTQGATLSIDSGASIDMAGFQIIVEGVLDVGSASLYSSPTTALTPGSHGQGLWPGIHITASGSAQFDGTIIKNASAAIYSEGTLAVTQVTIEDAYRGVYVNGGTATISQSTINHMDYEGLLLGAGTVSLDDITMNDVAIGVESSTTTTTKGLILDDVGVGLNVHAGQFIGDEIEINDATVGIASTAGASVQVSNLSGGGLALAIDGSDVDDFSLESATFSGNRLLWGPSIESISMHNISFYSNQNPTQYTVDSRCLDTCIFHGLNLYNSTKAMAISGPGTTFIDHSTIRSGTVALSTSGDGQTVINNSVFESEVNGVNLQSASSTLVDVYISLGVDAGEALMMLGGMHALSNVHLEKPYSNGDHTSIGLRGWYTSLSAEDIWMNNYSTSVYLEDSDMSATSLSAMQGVDVGIQLINSEFYGDELTTQAQTIGVNVSEQSHLQLVQWSASLHEPPLFIEQGSSAAIRFFDTSNTASTSFDATGNGDLWYGSHVNPSISISSSNELHETQLTVTDFSGNPIVANLTVHGFIERSDSNGAATLPLIQTGSLVDVSYLGAGVRKTLFGGQMGQSVQVPVIPQGDWTISSSQHVVLGPKPDGSPHMMTGSLIVQGSLTLVDTQLVVPQGSTSSIEGSGLISGEAGVLSTDTLQLSGLASLAGVSLSQQLTVEGDIEWACQSAQTITSVEVDGDMLVQPSCEIDIEDGRVNGAVTARTGAHLTIHTSLSIHVLDKGEPVEGALISIDGTTALTDSQGIVSTSGIARDVTDASETWGEQKTVSMQYQGIYDYFLWDSNLTTDHTFVASTVPTGSFDGWFVLQRQWSPYVLASDLYITTTGTLTIQDGVSLRMNEATTITVNGHLDAGSSTLASTGSGARWGGLVLGTSAGALIELQGTNVVESSPALTISGYGTVSIDDSYIARSGADPLIVISSGSAADVSIRNSQLTDAGNGCVQIFQSTGLIVFDGIEFSNCQGTAVWARQSQLEFRNVEIGEGCDIGFEFTGVSGFLRSVTGVDFTGTGAFVVLESIHGDFEIDGLHSVVGGQGGIVGSENKALILRHITIIGSPAVDFDGTSGQLIDSEFTGLSSGTALILHHGRSLDGFELDNVSIEDYNVGINLHLDPGEEAANINIRNSAIHGLTALSSSEYDVILENTELDGLLEIYSAQVSCFDCQVQLIDVTETGRFTAYKVLTVEAQLLQTPVYADFSLNFVDVQQSPIEFSGISPLVHIPLYSKSSQDEFTVYEINITANSPIAPSYSGLVNISAFSDDILVLTLVPNQTPIVTLVEPYSGQRVMETNVITATAQISDDINSLDELTIVWNVYDLSGEKILTGGFGEQYNVTDLTAGYYLVEITVVDTFGATTTASVDIEFTLLDSDGDWTGSCDSQTWFDATTGKSCGPNLYDADDDNDGISDAKDHFPLDVCAWQDSDGDGQPNDLNCPEGTSTWLTADMDDDGDGIPDSLEGQQSNDGDENLNAIMLVVIVFIVVALLFMMRIRKGGGTDFSIDSTHL